MNTSRLCRLPTAVGAVICLIVAASAQAQFNGPTIRVTVDANGNYVFPTIQQTHDLNGTAMIPLGSAFAPVPTRVEFFQQQSAPGEVIAHFPGQQAGNTVEIGDGDPVPFQFSVKGIPYLVRMTALGTPGFGGGLGTTFEFTTMADLEGSGTGWANVNLPNLGLLSQITSMSLLLGNNGSFFAQHDLGVDLNGDAANDTLTINNAILAFFLATGEVPTYFSYAVQPSDDGELFFEGLLTPQELFELSTAGNVNPNFGLMLDTVEWTLTQDLLIPAVPEPASAALLAVGNCLLLGRRPRDPRFKTARVRP
jgi:hypothetical protein